MTKKLIDDCFVSDKPRLRHSEALAILKERIAPVVAGEQVGLADAGGRILAQSIVAVRPVPAHTNSAVDGFSFAAADYDRDNGCVLSVSARAAAGHALSTTPQPQTAVRILTGAVLPHGHDTVVMQEDVTVRTVDGQTTVALPAGLRS